MSIKTLFAGFKSFTVRHSTAITVTCAVIGYGAAIVTAIRETKTYESRIEELKIDKNGEEPETKEKVIVAAKSYWPTAVIFALSTTSLLMGQKAAYKRAMSLSTAYSMTDKAFKEYKKQVERTITDKKKSEVNQNVDQEKARQITPRQIEVAERTGNGDILCMERWTGRMFYSDPVFLKQEFVRINGDFVSGGVCSLNQLLDAWGLRTSAKDIGECLGWRLDVMGEALTFSTSSTLTSDDIPVLVVGTEQFPDYDYSVFRGC